MNEKKKQPRWIRIFGAWGFAVVGVIYVIIGLSTLVAALTWRDAQGGYFNALGHLSRLPGGKILLFLAIIGLGLHGVWRLLQGVMDIDAKGSRFVGWCLRCAYIIIGVFYLGMSFLALCLLSGIVSSAGNKNALNVLDELSKHTLFNGIAIIIGIGLLGAAIFYLYFSVTANFKIWLTDEKAHPQKTKKIIFAGRCGYAARAAIYGVMGSLAGFAGLSGNLSQAKGFSGTLHYIETQYFGVIFLAFIAIGLIFYGSFLCYLAKYRRLEWFK